MFLPTLLKRFCAGIQEHDLNAAGSSLGFGTELLTLFKRCLGKPLQKTALWCHFLLFLLNYSDNFNQSMCFQKNDQIKPLLFTPKMPLQLIFSHAKQFWLIVVERPGKEGGWYRNEWRFSAALRLCASSACFMLRRFWHKQTDGCEVSEGEKTRSKRNSTGNGTEARISQSQTLSIKHHSSIAHFMFALAVWETWKLWV